MKREVRPARWEEDEDFSSTSDRYLFSPQHYDNAFHIEAEMLVSFAREMLYEPDQGVDPYDTPVIRQRRQEAALAALDVLWALMAHKNRQEVRPRPQPALVALTHPDQRRLRRVGPRRS